MSDHRMKAFADELHRHLLATVHASEILRGRITIDSVRRDESDATAVVVVLHDSFQPGCTFATRCSPELLRAAFPVGENEVLIAVSVCAANIEEQITGLGHGLPAGSPGETVWF